MAQTQKSNLVVAEVFADSITQKLGDAIKLYSLAFVQNFENEQAGTIQVPRYEYIGDAEVIAEGVAIDPTLLNQNSEKLDIVKVGKAVEITDEATKGGFGDPIGQAETQVTKSIGNGIDNKMFEALDGATLVYNAEGSAVTGNVVLNAVALFGEDQDGEKYILAHPNQTASIKTDKNYIDGKLFDMEVIFSNKVTDSAFVVKPEALGLYLSKDVEVETDRDILKKLTVLSADSHFATHLRDASKAVKIVFA